MQTLQQIAENIDGVQFSNLCIDRKVGTLELRDYQFSAIENITKLLLEYGNQGENYKQWIKKEYEKKGVEHFTRGKKPEQNYYENESCFWMATGSGKTFVIAKLVEILIKLMNEGRIPKRNILLLAPSETILEQTKHHIQNTQVEVVSLKQKGNNDVMFDTVYLHNSNNIAEGKNTSKDKKSGARVNYEDYGSDWYIILDEAHRGTKDGVRKDLYSKMAENGFIFNFSATFTESCDKNATIYNYNLKKFIEAGYGKEIAIMQSEYAGFGKKADDFSSEQKIDTTLKSIILYTAIKKSWKSIDGFEYHNPLMIGVADTVSLSKKSKDDGNLDEKKKANLMKFFEAIVNFGAFQKNFNTIKEDLQRELNGIHYTFTGNLMNVDLANISFTDILQQFFNTDGTADTFVYAKNAKENQIAIQMKNAKDGRYFALVNVGDIRDFEKMLQESGAVHQKTVDNNFFKTIDDKSSTINLLLGSRCFSEGWDSNRPNIINFINIGSKDAEKYVLQTIGRGLRVEPKVGGNRKRQWVSEPNTKMIESLFVFATSKDGVDTILNSLSKASGTNPKERLVPMEKDIFKIEKYGMQLYYPYFEERKGDGTRKIKLSHENSQEIKTSIDGYSLKNLVCKLLPFAMNKDVKANIHNSLKNLPSIVEETDTGRNEYSAMKNLIDAVNFPFQSNYEFVDIREVDANTINHFTKITMKVVGTYSEEDVNNLKRKIKEQDTNATEFIIKKLQNHYYNPFLVSKGGNVDFTHIIKQSESEHLFLEELAKNIEALNKKYTKWCFCRIAEKIDNIFIPYKGNKRFYPDFIFWLEGSDGKQNIYFIDPKGLQKGLNETSQKIEGFKEFEKSCEENRFKFKLGLWNKEASNGKIEEHRFWNINDFF